MRITVTLFLVITVSLAVAASESGLTAEQAARGVVFLHVPSANPVEKSVSEIGTGFLVEYQAQTFLVTADHVAKLMTSKASLTLAGEDDKSQTFGMKDLTSSECEPGWVIHPVADVAVLRLNPNEKIRAVLAGRGFPTSIFVPKLEAPPRDRPLTVFGFPLGLGAFLVGPDRKVSPISVQSKAASGLLTLARFDTKQPTEFFILDSPSVGGYSGAPVLILPAAYSKGAGLSFSVKTFFVGLVHGTVSDDTGGKFALIVPSAFVTQTLHHAFKDQP